MAQILYLSTLLVMGLFVFNALFNIWNSFINFYVKRIQFSLYYAARRFQNALSNAPVSESDSYYMNVGILLEKIVDLLFQL